MLDALRRRENAPAYDLDVVALVGHVGCGSLLRRLCVCSVGAAVADGVSVGRRRICTATVDVRVGDKVEGDGLGTNPKASLVYLCCHAATKLGGRAGPCQDRIYAFVFGQQGIQWATKYIQHCTGCGRGKGRKIE